MVKRSRLCLALSFLFLSGCGNSFASKSLSLEDSDWRVVAISGKSVLVGANINMHFSQNRVSGNSGCNRYSATYQSDFHSIQFSEAAVTKMWCASPEGVVRQENDFLQRLHEVKTYAYDEARLTFKGANGDMVLTLSKK